MESLLKEFKKTDLTAQLAEAENQVESISKNYNKHKQEKIEVDGISKKLNAQIVTLAKKMFPDICFLLIASKSNSSTC